MYAITQKAESSKNKQDELLNKIDKIAEIKNQDLKDLKEENDLSEQGIAVEPKPFKSITEENNALRIATEELETVIISRNKEIEELESLYDDKFEAGTEYLDEVNLFYKNTIERLKAEQVVATEAKLRLESRLEEIRVATIFERNRRIKRAAFDNERERYNNDRLALFNIKQTTQLLKEPLKEEDFDFGEEQSGNIQILKNINRLDEGYYLILAVHSDKDKRDDFVTKVYASGQEDVDFFYDETTSKYYIYYSKFNSIQAANRALESKENKPYNLKISLVKIEN